jgi:hypothetical protein
MSSGSLEASVMTEELHLSLPTTGRESVFETVVSPGELRLRPESVLLLGSNVQLALSLALSKVEFWAASLMEPIKVPMILSAVQAPPIILQPFMTYESRTMSFFT